MVVEGVAQRRGGVEFGTRESDSGAGLARGERQSVAGIEVRESCMDKDLVALQQGKARADRESVGA